MNESSQINLAVTASQTEKMVCDLIIQKVQKPTRYMGYELNSVHRDWKNLNFKMSLDRYISTLSRTSKFIKSLIENPPRICNI